MDNLVGVVVGRFQVPTPTEAHIELLTYALTKYDTVIVFVGHAPIQNRNNIIPSTIVRGIVTRECRKICNEKELNTKIIVSNIIDVYNIPLWSSIIDDKIDFLLEQNGVEKYSINLIGGRDSFIDSYMGKHKNLDRFISELGDEINASEIRRSIYLNGPEENPAFLRGMIYERLRAYLTAFQTVDSCILFEDYVLLGKRSPSHKWQFVGGFSDPESDSLEEDAIRETFEETGLKVTDAKYIASTRVDDRRYLGTGDCIKTALFTVKASDMNNITTEEPTKPNGFDDLPYIRWFKLAEVEKNIIIDIHWKLFDILKAKNIF